MNIRNVYPFNNEIETGLRIFIILTVSFPVKYDIDHLIYFDYMTVHSGGINPEIESLHPAVPNRGGEIFIRRSLIQSGIDVFIKKGLIARSYTEQGIQYGATELAVPFLEVLSESYTIKLIDRANWIFHLYGSYRLSELRDLMTQNLLKIRNEFNLEIIR